MLSLDHKKIYPLLKQCYCWILYFSCEKKNISNIDIFAVTQMSIDRTKIFSKIIFEEKYILPEFLFFPITIFTIQFTVLLIIGFHLKHQT